ncbi:MAG TPA: primosomal protein N' [Candidatus Saccharimonadales bacterium]
MQYIEVAPLTIFRQDTDILTYETKAVISPGTIVTIPIGKRTATGVVYGHASKPIYITKPIIDIVETEPLPKPLLDLARWMSNYYSVHLATVLQGMLPAGLRKNRRIKNSGENAAKRTRTNFVLNKAQLQALDAISHTKGKTVLLHGITGSGKTAVYIEAVKKVLASGKSAIVLTPEISLTPQIVAEFQHYFKQIVLTHSQLTEANRHQQWLRALNATTPQIIIGPRSALFLPLKHIGVIIIDEAHEPSYKQEQQPRYSAQRVARILANYHGADLILGTATPSVNDYYLAQKSGTIVSLHQKAKAQQNSQAQIVDASKRQNFSRNQLFSNKLIKAINQQLTNQRQVLLFHNRRGTASSTLCEHCGWHAACERCLLPLTLHADTHKLLCHVCGATHPIPPHCPMCKHADIIFKGVGTKKIEAEAIKLFPQATIARFDADAKHDEQLHKQYQAIYDGDIDIIIGTQLLAKGLDLPKLGLVGLVQADAGLLLPDFQAKERVFQLISQACGRVGRQEHPTEVIVQTFYPRDDVVAAGVNEDYERFYKAEISERRHGNYPPFTHMLKLVCAYKTEAGALKASRSLAKELGQAYANVEVIGPTPAFYERLRGLYRWQVLIKSNSRQQLQAIALGIPKQWQVELDPYSLIS